MNGYDVFLCGSDRRVLAPLSPICRITRELLSDAARMLDSGDPLLGLDLLQRAAQMKQQDKKVSSLLASFRAKLAESHVAVATQIYEDGRWLESLYHSDRANALFPDGRLGEAHWRRIRPRILLLYLGPAAAVVATGSLAGLVTGKAMVFLGAFSAAACGAASLRAAGASLRKNMHAVLVSAVTAAAALIIVIAAVLTSHPVLAVLASAAAPVVVWAALRLAAARTEQPATLPSEPTAEAVVKMLQEQLAVEWPHIQAAFADLPVLSAYSGRSRDAAELASARQERRAAAVAEAVRTHTERLAESVKDSAKIFEQITTLLHDSVIAQHRGDARGLAALRRDAPQLVRALNQGLTQLERISKRRRIWVHVSHSQSDCERVLADPGDCESRVKDAVRRIRIFAKAIAGMHKPSMATPAKIGDLHAEAAAAFETMQKSAAGSR